MEWGEITSTLEIIGVESSMGGEGRMVTVWLTSHPVIWGEGKEKRGGERRGEEFELASVPAHFAWIAQGGR